jgi:hypothetical protein
VPFYNPAVLSDSLVLRDGYLYRCLESHIPSKTFDPTKFSIIPHNNQEVNTSMDYLNGYYVMSIDDIEYDIDNDVLLYRKDNKGNSVYVGDVDSQILDSQNRWKVIKLFDWTSNVGVVVEPGSYLNNINSISSVKSCRIYGNSKIYNNINITLSGSMDDISVYNNYKTYLNGSFKGCTVESNSLVTYSVLSASGSKLMTNVKTYFYDGVHYSPIIQNANKLSFEGCDFKKGQYNFNGVMYSNKTLSSILFDIGMYRAIPNLTSTFSDTDFCRVITSNRYNTLYKIVTIVGGGTTVSTLT